MPSLTRQIPPAVWEQYKSTILDLRRAGFTLKGEYGIMAKMRVEYGFEASHAQYELQFKRWGERKNLSAAEWCLVFQVLDQHTDNGLNWDLYMNGQFVPPEKLERKRRHYSEGQRGGQFQARAATALPECIEIRTSKLDDNVSGAMDVDDHQNTNASTTFDGGAAIEEPLLVHTSSYRGDFDAYQAGDFDLGTQIPERILSSQDNTATTGGSSAPTADIQRFGSPFLGRDPSSSSSAVSFPMRSVVPTNENVLDGNPFEIAGNFSLSSPLSNGGFLIPTPGNGAFAVPEISLDDMPDWGTFDDWTSNLPILGSERNLDLQESPRLEAQPGTHPQRPAANQSSNPIVLGRAEDFRMSPADRLSTYMSPKIFQGGPSMSIDASMRLGMINFHLSPLLLPASAVTKTISSSRDAAWYEAFNHTYQPLIVSMENNFAGLVDGPKAVLELLKQDLQLRFQLSRYFRAKPNPISKALAETLVRAAIESGDAVTVADLLKTGLFIPDEIVCLVDGQRYTAVERSAMLGNVEVARTLLDARADVNKTYGFHSYGERGRALELAIKWGKGDWWNEGVWKKKDCRFDMPLITMLLDYNAEVRPEHLHRAIDFRDAALISALMSKSPSLKHSAVFHTKRVFDMPTLIEGIVVRADSENVTTIVTQIFRSSYQTDCPSCLETKPDMLQRLMAFAALKGHRELVEFLLDYTKDKGLALAAAVRGGQGDMVDLLLKMGARTDVRAYKLDYDCVPTFSSRDDGFLFTTPLAEAVRAENNELIRDFEARGALRKIERGRRFDAAILAASEVGNSMYVRKLLQSVPEVGREALGPALSISMENGYAEIAFALLKAGANANRRLRRTSPLAKALTQRNMALVDMIMECDVRVEAHDVELAVQWGNISIIENLLWMGAHVSSRVVTAAVRTRNKPLLSFFVKESPVNSNDLINNGTLRDVFPLEVAVSNSDIEMIQYLLDLGADPSLCNAIKPAIYHRSGDRRALDMLLKAYCARYPTGKKGFGGRELLVALEEEDAELLDTLLQTNFDVNAFSTRDDGQTITEINTLGVAIERPPRRLDVIKKLIPAGSNPNGVVWRLLDRYDRSVLSFRTALLQAIDMRSQVLVDFLISVGADVNQPARRGLKRTPLQYACEVGSMEIVELLLEKGANVNEAPALRGGATSLQLCAIQGHIGIADKFLKLGADIHAMPAQAYGRTPMEGAAEHGRLDMLKLLWDNGVRERFDRKQYTRATKLARKNGHIACCDLIEELFFISQGYVNPQLLID